MLIESKTLKGMRVLIRMSDISAVWEDPRVYPDFKTKYKVCLTNRQTFTFNEIEGEEIYEAYKAHLRGE